MQDFDITTLIFLGLAVFVIWKLRSVLGQKTGAERPPFDSMPRDPMSRDPMPHDPMSGRDSSARPGGAGSSDGDNVVRLPGGGPERPAPVSAPAPDRWKGIAEPGTRIAQELDAIARVEPDFDARAFLEGAKSAYEMIVIAYAQGDRPVLKDLLSRDVFEGFDRAIADRDKRGETVETTFVSIDKAEIVGAEVRGMNAQVVVRFLSKLITVTRDASGKIIDGSPDAVVDVTDIWTFARSLGSRDPNWMLVATEAGQ